MYHLKQYIKSIFRKLTNKNTRQFEKECKDLNNFICFAKSKKELKKNLTKFNKIYDAKINEFIFDKINKKNNSIERLLKKLNIKDDKKILFYYKFFIFKGWLVDSFFLRKFYLKLNKNKKIDYSNIIENNNLELQNKLYYRIKEKTYIDESLKNFFFNKNVAIVGPALSKDKNAAEIDKYDIVVRINQIDQSNLSNISKGKKIDIIYLNGTKTEEIIKLKNLEFIKKAKAVIFKTDGYVKFFKRLNFDNVYKNINIDRYMMIGISNMLPYILFEILVCNPKSIKIFDNDFLVNPKRVKNYEKHNLDQKSKFLSIIFQHDPLSQFNFVKFLYNASNVVKGDKKFTKVINLDQKKFLSKLEKSYDLN